METLHEFADLFEGRYDVIGGDAGVCLKASDPTQSGYYRTIEAHLFGDEPIGVYPMVDGEDGKWYVRWGCVDFDIGDGPSMIHARNVQTVLRAFNITAWIELSRSKGVHVWVFLTDFIEAAQMRHGLLGACQTVGAPTTEINPKNTRLAEGKVGNYVRLPYPRSYEETGRRCMVDENGEVIALADFVERAMAHRVTPNDIESIQHLYEPPPKPKPARVKYVEEPRNVSGRVGGLSRHILRNGPKEGGDRSSALYALAQSLHRDGVSLDEALTVVYSADSSWGKHIERGDPEYLDRMCQKVWGL